MEQQGITKMVIIKPNVGFLAPSYQGSTSAIMADTSNLFCSGLDFDLPWLVGEHFAYKHLPQKSSMEPKNCPTGRTNIQHKLNSSVRTNCWVIQNKLRVKSLCFD